MEPQQESSNGDGSCGKGGFVSRQSSTRWSPTSEQIRILKDLYYNYGIRSPSAEQIQNISTRLRQYGKIEAKNVFYWFQNHKARDRLKRTFTSDHAANITSTGVSFASSSAAGMVTADQKGSYGYGSLTMEKSFRDCLISDGGRNGTASNNYDLGCVETDPYSSTYTTFFDKTRPTEEVQEADGAPEIETLPLFPVQAEHIHGYYNLNKSASFYNEEGFKNTSSASLELCLNSYTSTSPDSTLNVKP